MPLKSILVATVVFIVSACGGVVAQQTTLRFVPHSDLKILDPIWTAAYITRNHGYMIYDTLFAMDAKGDIKPQMVDVVDVSADGLTYTMRLRDDLLWHDGTPVTAEDCIASINRWAARDGMGQKLMTFVRGIEPRGSKTIVITLKERTGLVLPALGKPSSNVPFMMPKRVAETDPNKQISETIGSGPFVFSAAEWKPGAKIVYTKFDRYKPRGEPASGLAGGKIAKVDRVEWLPISDHLQAVNALLGGEVDYIESPPHDLHDLILRDGSTRLEPWNTLGNQFVFRFNTLQAPFDNPRVREALWYAFNQADFLGATVGNPKYYKLCKAMFVCGTQFATEAGMEGKLEGDFQKARELLHEAGYDGRPIVLMQSTDLQILTNLAPVAKALMEKVGFVVEMQTMDWQTLVARRAKKDPPQSGGWHAFLTSLASADVLNPITAGYLNAGCERAMFGWPCDATIERLRDDFARSTVLDDQKAIIAALQKRVIEYPTHIHLGQWYGSGALRNTVEGLVPAPAPVLWNMSIR